MTRLVTADDVRPLRMAVLRTGRPPETSVLAGDDDPLTRHVAVSLGGEIVSVGTVMPEPPPWEPARPESWRVRGMATVEAMRGRGMGGLVLAELIAYATSAHGTLLWCAARVPAIAFYERYGLASRGEPFDSEGVEHVHMWRELRPVGAP
jgi:predicted GNAT family N-acyltransferase